MSTQLDILALEPFYGGARRHMLETILRCSRHRWTLLKLPPRRIERRLSVAANWFAEQLTRHWSSRSDILFTSEAMNLASLYQLMPSLARQPSVVYFHDNQMSPSKPARRTPGRSFEEIAKSAHEAAMDAPAAPEAPEPGVATQAPPARDVDLELVNLNTATAATEIWFNTNFHLRGFLAGAAKLVRRHTELSSADLMPDLTAKARLMPPPIDLNLVPHVKATGQVPKRDSRAIFVDTRDGQLRVLNAALAELASRGEKFRLITIGPVDELSDHWPRRTIGEAKDIAHAMALWEAGVVLSVRPGATCDLQVIRGLQAGCRPVLPEEGFYAELIPAAIRDQCLYKFSVDGMADALQEAINPPMAWNPPDFRPALRGFEAIAATRVFDERLSHLALAHGEG